MTVQYRVISKDYNQFKIYEEELRTLLLKRDGKVKRLLYIGRPEQLMGLRDIDVFLVGQWEQSNVYKESYRYNLSRSNRNRIRFVTLESLKEMIS